MHKNVYERFIVHKIISVRQKKFYRTQNNFYMI